MLLRSICFTILAILIPSTLLAQATIVNDKSAKGEDFRVVLVDAAHYVQLQVSTTSHTQEYLIHEEQAGEYRRALSFTTTIKNDTLFIKDWGNPTFKFPQDKLSAHKITDSRILLEIPKHKELFINAVNANLEIEGSFKTTTINLANGSLLLENMKGDIKVVTTNASTKAMNLTKYRVKVFSRSGRVQRPKKRKNHLYSLTIESITGNIDID